VALLEETVAATNESIQGLSRSVGDLSESLKGLAAVIRGDDHDPKAGLLWRVSQHDERREIFNKVLLAVMTAATIGLLAWMLRLYAMLQSVKG
jgi:hypothetical protein